jgi:hypothetical protein
VGLHRAPLLVVLDERGARYVDRLGEALQGGVDGDIDVVGLGAAQSPRERRCQVLEVTSQSVVIEHRQDPLRDSFRVLRSPYAQCAPPILEMTDREREKN